VLNVAAAGTLTPAGVSRAPRAEIGSGTRQVSSLVLLGFAGGSGLTHTAAKLQRVEVCESFTLTLDADITLLYATWSSNLVDVARAESDSPKPTRACIRSESAG
jgi:hypothetical protein